MNLKVSLRSALNLRSIAGSYCRHRAVHVTNSVDSSTMSPQSGHPARCVVNPPRNKEESPETRLQYGSSLLGSRRIIVPFWSILPL